MAETCIQVAKIAKLEATEQSTAAILNDVKQDQKKTIELLEKIATQGERINHVEADVRRLGKNDSILFDRVRVLEIKPAEEVSKVRIGFWNALIAAGISIIVALILRG